MIVEVLHCPYCGRGRGVLGLDVAALRGVVGCAVVNWSAGPAPEQIVFDPDRAGGVCPHLADLNGTAGWEWRDADDDERPGGCVELVWTHPDRPDQDVGGNEFIEVVLRPGSAHPLRPRVPILRRSANLARPVPAVRRGRWTLWLWGTLDACYAADAGRYWRLVGEARKRSTGGTSRGEP